jgi:hypothetical protein
MEKEKKPGNANKRFETLWPNATRKDRRSKMLRELLLSLLNFSFWLALPAAALKLWRSIYRPREWEAKGTLGAF